MQYLQPPRVRLLPGRERGKRGNPVAGEMALDRSFSSQYSPAPLVTLGAEPCLLVHHLKTLFKQPFAM